MTTFFNRALGVLDRLYRFRGGLNTLDAMDLSGQIQPVHDVSREVEVGSGLGAVVSGGYWWIGPAHVHAGADEQLSSTDPRTVIAAAPPANLPTNPLDFDVWYLGTFVDSLTEASISVATTVARFPAGTLGQVLAHSCILAHYAAQTAVADGAGGLDSAALSLHTSPLFIPRPLLLPIGTQLNTRTVSLLAATITLVNICWVGPRGALPPGLP